MDAETKLIIISPVYNGEEWITKCIESTKKQTYKNRTATQQHTTTTYAPQPSALQAGLGVGLSTLGALGNFFNQGNNQRQQTPYTI